MENQEISINEAKVILERIIDVNVMPFRQTDEITLFFVCAEIPVYNEIIKIIAFNRIEIDFSRNDKEQYIVTMVFVDQQVISFPIITKWTNEDYFDINLLVNEKRIKKINAFCNEDQKFPAFPSSNEIEFIRYHSKVS